MELTIDKSGRFVLPKRLREHLGVGLSLKVAVKETSEGILLQPVVRESGLVRENGLLVHRGSPANRHIDIQRYIDEDRDERAERVLRR